jgi:very-short-patch-repair endonuclease
MPEGRRKVSPEATEFVDPHRDRALAGLAQRLYGVVARRQMRELGFKETAIAVRVRTGRLHRVHHGVYAVGHPVLAARGRWMAAVLACGRRAALSHASAAALWELRPSAAVTVDVTVRTPGGRARAGLRIHRTPSMPPAEVIVHDGIPVTTPERTLLDLAGTLTPRQLERTLDQAEILQLIDSSTLDALVRTHSTDRGATRLSATLERHHPGTTLTRSELEEMFLELCRAHALPCPRVNTHVAGLEVDFLFATQRLVVETDGWSYHRTRTAFERDRHRDAALIRGGYRVLRFTHRQLERERGTVAATVAAALSPRGARGRSDD